MDDLNGLQWSPKPDERRKIPISSGLHVRQSNLSGRSTPLSFQSEKSNSPKPATPANDSFANLVCFGASNASKNLSLLEQQRKLQEERSKKEAEQRTKFEAQYGARNAQFWDHLEQSGKKSPNTATHQHAQISDDDDLLAAFNASAPRDSSTNFPVPGHTLSPRLQTAGRQEPTKGTSPVPGADGLTLFDDDDDPFGLQQLKSKTLPDTRPEQADEDDFLGDLSKPVSEFPRVERHDSPAVSSSDDGYRESGPADGVDRAIAELVEMGFPADEARQALSSTTSGTDVQAAVGWLLNCAHAKSRQQAKDKTAFSPSRASPAERYKEFGDQKERIAPSWMKEDASRLSRNRSANGESDSRDLDPAQVASSFGNQILKTANTLWKTGSKRMQQVVHDLNADYDSSQPRWMKDSAATGTRPGLSSTERRQGSNRAHQTPSGFTDEALLLESDSSRLRTGRRQTEERADTDKPCSRYDPQTTSFAQLPSFAQPKEYKFSEKPRSGYLKTAVEEQSAQAYVSPARRKKPVTPQSRSTPEVDLLESSARRSPQQTRPTTSSHSTAAAKPVPEWPKAPPRTIPETSKSALEATHRHREQGAEAFKRGDYAVAHESLTSALTMLPESHPLTIIIRSNRAMTALKIGEPKSAIGDADAMLAVIGSARGEGETIEVGNGEPNKPMRGFFGKALMRKAEALEQLERWSDAAQVWRQAVETGHGGSTSVQGRSRCENAAGLGKPAPKSAVVSKVPKPAAKKSSTLQDLAGTEPNSSTPNFEAVNRLRAANEAAERLDEEKFVLSESVDARIAAWKSGKQDNLRALLASLDTVLGPEAGWKKINMSELVLPNKVKLQYMKGIAKVHPDKIPTNATTEQRMIAGAVFATLNAAWDKFKKENNL